MEELTKFHVDWKKIVVVGLLVVLTGLTTGGLTWYVADSGRDAELDAKDQTISDLDTRIKQLEADVTPTTGTTKLATDLTDAQIYAQVESQLKLVRGDLTYFRIYGQDKVTFNTGNGITYAYKVSDTWKIAQENAQAVAQCSTLTNVPEAYRPPCLDSATGTYLYLKEDKTSLNYPTSDVRTYIGE